MLQLVINGSWQQFTQPLHHLIPFRTHGNLRGVVGAYPTHGRLPAGWQDLYLTQAKCNLIDYTVVSYDTPIAWRVRSDDVLPLWWFPGVRYSVTTSKTQGRIATALAEMDVIVRDSLRPGPVQHEVGA